MGILMNFPNSVFLDMNNRSRAGMRKIALAMISLAGSDELLLLIVSLQAMLAIIFPKSASINPTLANLFGLVLVAYIDFALDRDSLG